MQRLSVLIVAAEMNWISTSRMPCALHHAGFDVTVLAPRDALVTKSRYARRVGHFPNDCTYALWVSTLVVDGIEVTSTNAWANGFTLLAVALIFGIVNAILKPIIKIFGCVFYVLTLGLIALVVNALLFLLTNWLAGLLRLPFHVDGFWPAFWGALIVGVVSWTINLVVPDKE